MNEILDWAIIFTYSYHIDIKKSNFFLPRAAPFLHYVVAPFLLFATFLHTTTTIALFLFFVLVCLLLE